MKWNEETKSWDYSLDTALNLPSNFFVKELLEEDKEITLKYADKHIKMKKSEWDELEKQGRTKLLYVNESEYFFVTTDELEKYKFYTERKYVFFTANNRQERKILSKISKMQVNNKYYLVNALEALKKLKKI